MGRHKFKVTYFGDDVPDEIFEADKQKESGDWFVFWNDESGEVARIRQAQVERIDRVS